MELIPILSTIILVATISTFILSIGAYILYKIREKQTVLSMRTAPRTLQAELVVPADVIPSRLTAQETKPSQYQSPYTVQKPASAFTSIRQPTILQEPIKISVEKDKKVYEPRQAYTRKTTENKFLKYTTEGYVTTEEDKAAGVLKWR